MILNSTASTTAVPIAEQWCAQESWAHCTWFICPYHAWTFGTNGDMTFAAASARLWRGIWRAHVGAGLGKSAARRPATAGFIFASQRAEGVRSPPTFLGVDVESCVRQFCRSGAGRRNRSSAGGKAAKCYRGNWKLHIENAIDFLHPEKTFSTAMRSMPLTQLSPAWSRSSRPARSLIS